MVHLPKLQITNYYSSFRRLQIPCPFPIFRLSMLPINFIYSCTEKDWVWLKVRQKSHNPLYLAMNASL